jgi:hypothetical protein
VCHCASLTGDVTLQRMNHLIDLLFRSSAKFSRDAENFWRYCLDPGTTAMIAACLTRNLQAMINRSLKDLANAQLKIGDEGDDGLHASVVRQMALRCLPDVVR